MKKKNIILIIISTLALTGIGVTCAAVFAPHSLASLLTREDISSITYKDIDMTAILGSEQYDDFFVATKKIRYRNYYGPAVNAITSYSLSITFNNGNHGVINGYYFNMDIANNTGGTSIRFVSGSITDLRVFFGV